MKIVHHLPILQNIWRRWLWETMWSLTRDITPQNCLAWLKKNISKTNESVKGQFSELHNSPIFIDLPINLDCKKWLQTNEKLMNFGDGKIHCLKKIPVSMFQWGHSKVEINLFSKNKKDYLSIHLQLKMSVKPFKHN